MGFRADPTRRLGHRGLRQPDAAPNGLIMDARILDDAIVMSTRDSVIPAVDRWKVITAYGPEHGCATSIDERNIAP